jgi:hypothetical protein
MHDSASALARLPHAHASIADGAHAATAAAPQHVSAYVLLVRLDRQDIPDRLNRLKILYHHASSLNDDYAADVDSRTPHCFFGKLHGPDPCTVQTRISACQAFFSNNLSNVTNVQTTQQLPQLLAATRHNSTLTNDCAAWLASATDDQRLRSGYSQSGGRLQPCRHQFIAGRELLIHSLSIWHRCD